MSRIVEGLYIGSVDIAKDLKTLRKLKITHILNASDYPNAFTDEFVYHRVKVCDDGNAKITKYLPASTAFIETGIQEGNVLVHCTCGVSRSATLVIGYLMNIYNLTEPEAYQYLKALHPRANPNQMFRLLLQN